MKRTARLGARPATIHDLRRALIGCRRLRNNTERKLVPVGLITSFLEPEKVVPAVYGGLAVEYHLSGSHDANDIDIFCTNPDRLADVLCQAGFKREYEFFSHPAVPVPIQVRMDEEADIRENYVKIFVRGYPVWTLTVEETILNYVHKFVETDDPGLEVVFAADLIEEYSTKLDLAALLHAAKSKFDREHFQILRALIALRACQIWPPD